MENLSVDLERKVKARVRDNAELNINAAIELYRNSEVSLSKAAEIAGITIIEFKVILTKRGIARKIDARPTVGMDIKLKKYLE